MKYAAITLLSLVCLGCFSVPTMEDSKSGIKCITEDENIRLLYLYQRTLVQDATYELNMHWAFRLALAEQHGKFKPLPRFELNDELSLAPHDTPGETAYSEHYYERAKQHELLGTQERLKLKEYQDLLSKRYTADSDKGLMFGSNGRACFAPQAHWPEKK